MTTLTATLTQGRRFSLVGVAGFVAALAIASQFAIPIPGTPVPLTLQPLVVVLAGMVLGPSLGAASMVVYLLVGALVAAAFGAAGCFGGSARMPPQGSLLALASGIFFSVSL